MYEASRSLLYVVLAVPLLIVAYVAFVVIVGDPIGLIILVWLGIAVMATKTWLGGDEHDVVDRISCPDCGAPNRIDADKCGYCDAPLVGT